MKTLGYVCAFLCGSITGAALGLLLAPREGVQTHVQRFLMLLTISARSMISSSAARKLRISLRISRMQLQTLSKL